MQILYKAKARKYLQRIFSNVQFFIIPYLLVILLFTKLKYIDDFFFNLMIALGFIYFIFLRIYWSIYQIIELSIDGDNVYFHFYKFNCQKKIYISIEDLEIKFSETIPWVLNMSFYSKSNLALRLYNNNKLKSGDMKKIFDYLNNIHLGEK